MTRDEAKKFLESEKHWINKHVINDHTIETLSGLLVKFAKIQNKKRGAKTPH